jgi:hypothetical protein
MAWQSVTQSGKIRARARTTFLNTLSIPVLGQIIREAAKAPHRSSQGVALGLLPPKAQQVKLRQAMNLRDRGAQVAGAPGA